MAWVDLFDFFLTLFSRNFRKKKFREEIIFFTNKIKNEFRKKPDEFWQLPYVLKIRIFSNFRQKYWEISQKSRFWAKTRPISYVF